MSVVWHLELVQFSQLSSLLARPKIGQTQLPDLTKKVKCNRQTVSNILTRFKEDEIILNRERIGRPKKTTERINRLIHLLARRRPKESAGTFREELKELNVCVSDKTVRNRLHASGLKGRFARKIPAISKVNVAKRLKFAKLHVKKPASFCRNILWTDEYKFQLHSNHRKQIVSRKTGEQFKAGMTKTTVKHSPSVMVWGCFNYKKQGSLHFIDRIMDGKMYKNILQEHLIQSASNMGLRRSFVFQQDNDPKHICNLVKKFINQSKINVLEWPPQSPDLNPIEHLWDEMDRKVKKSQRTSMKVFKNALKQTWDEIDSATLQNLVNSIPKRLKEVIKNRGYATKY